MNPNEHVSSLSVNRSNADGILALHVETSDGQVVDVGTTEAASYMTHDYEFNEDSLLIGFHGISMSDH